MNPKGRIRRLDWPQNYLLGQFPRNVSEDSSTGRTTQEFRARHSSPVPPRWDITSPNRPGCRRFFLFVDSFVEKLQKNVQILQEWKRRKRIWAISKITARRSTVCRCCRPFAKHFEIYFVPFFCLNKKESNKSFAWRLIDGVSSGGMLRLRRRLGMRRMTTTATSWTPRGMDRFTASCSSRRQSTNSVACSAEIIIKNCARVV